MIYSTCALSPDENDKVISKLFKKFKDVEILKPEISLEYKKFAVPNSPEIRLPEYEKTEFGAHVLPDLSCSADEAEKSDFCTAGPLYFCLLRKKEM